MYGRAANDKSLKYIFLLNINFGIEHFRVLYAESAV